MAKRYILAKGEDRGKLKWNYPQANVFRLVSLFTMCLFFIVLCC